MNHYFPLVFTCKNDNDCYGNGYCHARQCKCSANYEYEEDCSHYGCKLIEQTFFSLGIKPLKAFKNILRFACSF